ncbi:NAD(P)/FAD-dependent oxidoreductase [Aeoliella sp. SH292]|uniref:NAD(P)/FAD-dependent oxidoreductase n=1 Tax=Aeoliella sp. SH292 TaxID=3454464 RepID=UPI003F96E20E
MASSDQSQVVVIGGGPAGSTVSTLLAQQGVQVELFEREKFPRFHIGESLIPETYWVFERLGMLPKMKASHFVEKYSVQFVSASGKVSTPFYFHENKPHECSQTWQVERSEFDTMMLENAREHGVTAHEGARVLDILFEGDRAVGVEVKLEDGTQRRVMADVVVDASGQSSMIINRFGLRMSDPKLNKGAIWTYFEGAYRDPGQNGGATLVLQTEDKKGWFWYIPQHNNVVSVGVVADFEYLFQGRGDHEQTFNEELDRCLNVKERVSIGKRVDRYHATKDYTYRASRAAGDGWVLVGDAFGFLDPLYSSGVLLALRSGAVAADAIAEGLAKGDTSAAQLGKWEADYVQGMNRMRRLVCEYYDGFSFGRFIRRFPHLKNRVTDLLIGDLFKDDLDEVFESMDLMYKEAETTA